MKHWHSGLESHYNNTNDLFHEHHHGLHNYYYGKDANLSHADRVLIASVLTVATTLSVLTEAIEKIGKAGDA